MLAMPANGVERELIQGELLEKPMTRHNPHHARTETKVAFYLQGWLEQQPEPRGEVMTGEVGVRRRRNPDTTVGIDVVYVSAELAAATPEGASLIDGPPVLAVKILSPWNDWEEGPRKVREYRQAGVVVRLLDPVLRTVVVYRPNAEPEMFNSRQELSGEPYLPGFRVPVARLFST
jgi:Uma2 family endonuclease